MKFIVQIEKLAKIEKLSRMAGMSTNLKTPLQRAIAAAGGMTSLARKLNLTGHATVYQWTRTRVPAEHCPAIERETGVRCEDLRPDVAWDVLRMQSSGAPEVREAA